VRSNQKTHVGDEHFTHLMKLGEFYEGFEGNWFTWSYLDSISNHDLASAIDFHWSMAILITNLIPVFHGEINHIPGSCAVGCFGSMAST
jgi:hypothetical protein